MWTRHRLDRISLPGLGNEQWKRQEGASEGFSAANDERTKHVDFNGRPVFRPAFLVLKQNLPFRPKSAPPGGHRNLVHDPMGVFSSPLTLQASPEHPWSPRGRIGRKNLGSKMGKRKVPYLCMGNLVLNFLVFF